MSRFLAALLWLSASPSGPGPGAQPAARDAVSFGLYKWQHRIGVERSTVVRSTEGTEIRTTFTFTDRGRPVPLSSLLLLAADGSPRSFQIWGSTSRDSDVDDRVVISGDRVTVDRRGAVHTEARPERFFVGSS